MCCFLVVCGVCVFFFVVGGFGVLCVVWGVLCAAAVGFVVVVCFLRRAPPLLLFLFCSRPGARVVVSYHVSTNEKIKYSTSFFIMTKE